jgi:hypothetical protein
MASGKAGLRDRRVRIAVVTLTLVLSLIASQNLGAAMAAEGAEAQVSVR